MCLATLRHIAREGGCWVVATATAMQGSDVPEDFPDRDRLFKPEEWINDGDAVVIKPSGNIESGPLNRVKGILYAVIDTEAAGRARRSLDVCGHYSRPDILLVHKPKAAQASSFCRRTHRNSRTALSAATSIGRPAQSLLIARLPRCMRYAYFPTI